MSSECWFTYRLKSARAWEQSICFHADHAYSRIKQPTCCRRFSNRKSALGTFCEIGKVVFGDDRLSFSF